MASVLDKQLQAIMDRLMAPRSVYERDTFVRGGQALAIFRHAPASLPELFETACREHRDQEFLIDGDVRLTFGQVHERARQAARGLIARHGVRPGDRIGIAAANSANWIIAWMAVLMAGGCATLLNGWWTGRELAEGVELAECALIIADEERAARLADAGCQTGLIPLAHGPAETSLAALLGADSDVALPALASDDLATILFTSGSTGRSKAAWSDHRALVQATMSFAAQSRMLAAQLTEVGASQVGSECALLCVPLFHVTGEVAVLLQSFLTGRRLVIMAKWDVTEAMRLIERERVTFFVGVPLMSFQIATHPERDRYDLSTCRSFAAGGAPRPVGQVGQIRAAMPHAYPLMGYGLTETNCVGCTNLNENYLAKPYSTGPATAPLVELQILGSGGDPVPAGERGEIAIRSVCNFGGYWNDAQATAQAIRPDGFFLTGDIGYLDADGYLFVVDRKKDIIIRSGENISCAEVEQAIYSHPDVAEASVFGLPDAHHGEVPVAVYCIAPGASLAPDVMRTHLAKRLATFKIPVAFWIHHGPLPRLGTQKVDKVTLKARYSRAREDARSAA